MGEVEVEVDSLTLVLMQECHNLYTDTEHGLVDIASSLGLSLLPPTQCKFEPKKHPLLVKTSFW